MRLVLSAASAK